PANAIGWSSTMTIRGRAAARRAAAPLATTARSRERCNMPKVGSSLVSMPVQETLCVGVQPCASLPRVSNERPLTPSVPILPRTDRCVVLMSGQYRSTLLVLHDRPRSAPTEERKHDQDDVRESHNVPLVCRS